MRAENSLLIRLGLSVAAAFLLASCARSIDMSVASIHQKTPEFDFLLYQDGWACLSQGTPGREPTGTSCPPTSGRQLRELFAQRSSARSLRDYLSENGANCRTTNTVTTCIYTRIFGGGSPVFGRQPNSAVEEGVELAVSFPTRDLGLAPEQIATTLKRSARVL